MLIIREKVEEHLLQTLREGLPGNRHCFHMRAGSFSERSFSVLPELISNWIGSENITIMICHDRDLFVFSPNLSEKVFAWLKEHFEKYYEFEPAIHTKLLSFYDVQNSGLGLIELAEAKLAKRLQAEKHEIKNKNIERKAMLKAEFVREQPDMALVANLSKRRNGRIKPLILLVEDDAFSHKLIATALEGYDVIFAEHGRSAIEKYLHKAPDIVFLDIDLPDVSGHDVLAKILSFDKQAYIVMLSGNSQSENVRNAISVGAKGFITKPFTKDRLLQHVARRSEKKHEKLEYVV